MKQKLSIELVLLQVIGFAFVIYVLHTCWYVCTVNFSWFSLVVIVIFVALFVDVYLYVLITKPKKILYDKDSLSLGEVEFELLTYAYIARLVPIWGALCFPTFFYKELKKLHNKKVNSVRL